MRYTRHIDYPANDRLRGWMKELGDTGLRPGLRIIERCAPSQSLSVERFWIEHYKRIGVDLLNFIYFANEEQLAAMREYRRKRREEMRQHETWYVAESLKVTQHQLRSIARSYAMSEDPIGAKVYGRWLFSKVDIERLKEIRQGVGDKPAERTVIRHRWGPVKEGRRCCKNCGAVQVMGEDGKWSEAPPCK